MSDTGEPRDEFHNWRDCESEDAKDSGYGTRKVGKEIHGGFKVGDVIEVLQADQWKNYEPGDRAFVSNIFTEGEDEVVVTTLDPRTIPDGHIAHGDFMSVTHIKQAIAVVTPEEEAEAIASIIKIREA